MSRISRWRLGDGVYHVYNRGLSSAMILSTNDEKNLFADLIRKKLKSNQLNVYHYCIMGNHFHFAVEVLDIRVLSSFISGLCSSYSKAFRARRHMGYGPLWQGRYKSILVQKEKYLFRLGRYIEQNPVRAGLVANAGDWQWSSAASYLNNQPDGIVDPRRHPLLSTELESPEEHRLFYLNYLQEFSEEDLNIFHSDATAIGDDIFKSKVTEIAGRKQIRRGRPSKHQ